MAIGFTTVAKARAVYEADVSDLKRGAVEAETAVRRSADGMDGHLKRVSTSTNALSGHFSRLGGIVKGLGFAAATTGFLGVGAAIGYVVKSAASFEQQLNVLKAVSGATSTQMKDLSARAKQLGADVSLPATSAKDAAAAMTELAKGGLKVTDVMSGARGVLELASAAQIGNAEAARITANALNAFGLSGEKASQVADLLANSANVSTGEVTDMALALQQSSASAAQLGIPIEDLTTGITLMANAGIKGQDAGTSLKTALQNLSVPTSKQSQLMKELGINVFDSTGHFVGLRSLTEQYSDVLAKASPKQQAYISGVLGGSDASRAFNIVLGAGLPKFDATEKAVTRVGGAHDLAAAQTKGFAGSMAALKSNVETLAINLGEKLLPSLTRLAKAASGFIGDLDKSGTSANNLKLEVESLAGFLQTMGRGAKSAADQVGGLKTVIEGLIALKVASSLVGYADSFTAIGGSAERGTGAAGAEKKVRSLHGSLTNLAKIGAITVGVTVLIELLMNKGSVDKVGNAIDSKLDSVFSRIPGYSSSAAAGALKGGGVFGSKSTGPSVNAAAGQTGTQQGIVKTAQAIAADPKQNRYVYGGGGPGGPSGSSLRHDKLSFPGYDCSSFVQRVMAQNGITVPRTSEAQYAGGTKIPMSQIQVGDLVFSEFDPHPGHVGVYVGLGRVLADSHTGDTSGVNGGSIGYTSLSAWSAAVRYGNLKPGDAKVSGGGAPVNAGTVSSGGSGTLNLNTTPKPAAAKGSPTDLPGGIDLSLARAEGTKSLADDIKANEAAVAFLTKKLTTVTDSKVKADLTRAINGYRNAIADAQKKLAEAAKAAHAGDKEFAQLDPVVESAIKHLRQLIGEGVYTAAEEKKLNEQIAKYHADSKKFAKGGFSEEEVKKLRAEYEGIRTAVVEGAKRVAEGMKAQADDIADIDKQIANAITNAQKTAGTFVERVFSPADVEAARKRIGQIRGILGAGYVPEGTRKKLESELAGLETALANGMQQAAEKVAIGRAKFEAAYDKFVTDALDAFDKSHAVLRDALVATFTFEDATFNISAGQETPLEKQLRERSEKRAEEEHERQRQALSDALDAAKEKGEGVAEAQAAWDDFLYNEETANLEKRAKLERTAADAALTATQANFDALTTVQRTAFETQLGVIEKGMEDGSISYQQGLEQIHNLFGEYQVPFSEQGAALSTAFATGISSALTAVSTALSELTAAIKTLNGELDAEVAYTQSKLNELGAMGVTGTKGSEVPDFGGVRPDDRPVGPRFAEGGEVWHRMLATVGEGGHEFILPEKKIPLSMRPTLVPLIRQLIRNGQSTGGFGGGGGFGGMVGGRDIGDDMGGAGRQVVIHQYLNAPAENQLLYAQRASFAARHAFNG